MSGKVAKPHDDAAFDELFERAAKAGQMMVVDFSMNGCGWCVKIAPTYEALAKEYRGAVFCKVMNHECPRTTRRFGVRGFPHFIFFVGGQQKATVSGGGPRAEAELKANSKKYYTGLPATSVGWGTAGAATTTAAPKQVPRLLRDQRKTMNTFLEQFPETSVNQAYHFLMKANWKLDAGIGLYMNAIISGDSSTPDYFGSQAESFLPRSRRVKKPTAAPTHTAAAAPASTPGESVVPGPVGLERQSSAERAAAEGNIFAAPAAVATASGAGAMDDALCPGGICPAPGAAPTAGFSRFANILDHLDDD